MVNVRVYNGSTHRGPKRKLLNELLRLNEKEERLKLLIDQKKFIYGPEKVAKES
jgi:hypothetical protein